MAFQPKRKCAAPGCGEVIAVGRSYCDAHETRKRKRYDKQRGTSSERGYDAQWRRVRKRQLAEHPLCKKCLDERGVAVQAVDVDHIKPFHGKSDPLRLDRSNLQSLCKYHHSRKTATEDGGWGRGARSLGR